MKKLLLLFLLSGASIHAMDNQTASDTNLKIVPYNIAEHGQAVQKLFSEAFPDKTPTALTAQAGAPDCHVSVLMHDNKPLGFAVCEEQLLNVGQTFPDLESHKNSIAKLNVLRINHFAIDKKHKRTSKRPGKGFGTRLLEYIKQNAQAKEHDVIALTAGFKSRPFYEKNGYVKTIPESTRYNYMALPLNEDAKDIIEEVKKERIEKADVVRFHPDLI